MKRILMYMLNLQLFSQGGEAAGVELSGENGADAEQNTVNAQDEFNELINGKFKEQFTKKTQEIIDKRFKKTKELEAFKEKFSPAIESLMEKYGVSSGDESKLIELINGDTSGKNEKTENNFENTATLRQRAVHWIKQGEELKNTFPDFDLRSEINENKLFSKLLLSGIDIKTAYEVAHKDEILSGAMAYTAGKVREQLVQGIQAKGMRPQENGVSASGAVVSSVDVNALTSNDILKILKKVENGASISF